MNFQGGAACPIWVAATKQESYADGPDGPRTVIWLAGCSIQCPGCQNRGLWARRDGQRRVVGDVALRLHRLSQGRPITITGGEPLDQPLAVAHLVNLIRGLDRAYGLPRRHIALYTGYTWEQVYRELADGDWPLMLIALEVDLLVDGPYMPELDDEMMQWRGSANQRPIDMPASVQAGCLLNPAAVVTLDWDSGQFIQIVGNHIIGTGGAVKALLGLTGKRIKRCGQAGDD